MFLLIVRLNFWLLFTDWKKKNDFSLRHRLNLKKSKTSVSVWTTPNKSSTNTINLYLEVRREQDKAVG